MLRVLCRAAVRVGLGAHSSRLVGAVLSELSRDGTGLSWVSGASRVLFGRRRALCGPVLGVVGAPAIGPKSLGRLDSWLEARGLLKAFEAPQCEGRAWVDLNALGLADVCRGLGGLLETFWGADCGPVGVFGSSWRAPRLSGRVLGAS